MIAPKSIIYRKIASISKDKVRKYIQFIVRTPVYRPRHSTMRFLVIVISIILIERREANLPLKKETHKDYYYLISIAIKYQIRMAVTESYHVKV